jgi:hypothetical protein
MMSGAVDVDIFEMFSLRFFSSEIMVLHVAKHSDASHVFSTWLQLKLERIFGKTL